MKRQLDVLDLDGSFPIDSIPRDAFLDQFVERYLRDKKGIVHFIRLCNVSPKLRTWCDEFNLWDRLFIQTIIRDMEYAQEDLVKYQNDPRYVEWKIMKQIMPDTVTRLLAYSLFYAIDDYFRINFEKPVSGLRRYSGIQISIQKDDWGDHPIPSVSYTLKSQFLPDHCENDNDFCEKYTPNTISQFDEFKDKYGYAVAGNGELVLAGKRPINVKVLLYDLINEGWDQQVKNIPNFMSCSICATTSKLMCSKCSTVLCGSQCLEQHQCTEMK